MLVASITSTITSFVGNHGLEAVFALMALDAVFPAASELVMAYAGALAAGTFASQHVSLFGGRIGSGGGALVAMALAGTIGYLLGSLVGYGVGAAGGRPLLDRHGRWLHLSHERLDRADAWFDEHGDRAVFLGRLTPVVRSFISIPAGVLRARLLPYTLLTLLGSAIWCFAIAGIGYGLGTGYSSFHHAFRYADVVAVVLVVALLALPLARRVFTTLARRAERPAR